MLQFRLKSVELCLCSFVIALKLSEFLQRGQRFLCLGVIRKAACYDTLLELLVIAIAKVELACGCNGRVLGDVIHHILEHHLGGVTSCYTEIIGDVRQRVRLYLNIRLDATAVTNFSSASSIEHLGQRVRNMLGVTSVRVFVVYCLDAAPAGDEVLAGGEFEICVIRQVERCLHKSLAVSACSDNHSTVEVLQRTSSNLTCRCCVAVYEHYNRHVGIYRFLRCLILTVGSVQFPLRCHQRKVVGHEHVHYLHSLVERAAAVATKVENKTFHALFLQVDESTAHLL